MCWHEIVGNVLEAHKSLHVICSFREIHTIFSSDLTVMLNIFGMFSNERYTYTKLDYFINLEDLRRVTLGFGRRNFNTVFVVYLKFYYIFQ